jgi:hypothetical protein
METLDNQFEQPDVVLKLIMHASHPLIVKYKIGRSRKAARRSDAMGALSWSSESV